MREVGKTSLQTYFKKAVIEAGGLVDHFKAPGRNGVPDFIVTWRRVGWAKIDMVEIKVDDGEISKLQEIDHAKRKTMNCHVKVLWSKADIDDYVLHQC